MCCLIIVSLKFFTMKKLLIIALVPFLFVLGACTKEEKDVTTSTNGNVKEMLGVLQASGINLGNVKVNEKKRCFIVEGDIAIDFNDIQIIKSLLNKPQVGTKAYRYPNPYYATLAAVSSIKVYVAPSVNNSGWESALNVAIDAWNTISPNSAVRIVVTSNSDDANLKISSFYENSQTIARGNCALNGSVGKFIDINTFYNYLSGSEKINTLVHEIGHVVGLAHTNGQSDFCTPILVSGTSAFNDPNAVMYPYSHVWNGFSSDEILTVEKIYPIGIKQVSVRMVGPSSAVTGSVCTYGVTSSNGDNQFEWEALDESGEIIQRGTESSFSVTMPNVSRITIKVRVSTSNTYGTTQKITLNSDFSQSN